MTYDELVERLRAMFGVQDRFSYNKQVEQEIKDKVVEIPTEEPKEVEIPVGGITPDGTVYEKEVRPQGNEPLYHEVRIDEDVPVDDKKKEEETGTEETDNTDDQAA